VAAGDVDLLKPADDIDLLRPQQVQVRSWCPAIVNGEQWMTRATPHLTCVVNLHECAGQVVCANWPDCALGSEHGGYLVLPREQPVIEKAADGGG
jgi:hypothetical protein